MSDFQTFPKIPRLNRDIIITEKIDGTNAAIRIEVGVVNEAPGGVVLPDQILVRAQSRNRFVVPGSDNHGFGTWVHKNAEALAALLGEGIHFGEWWGQGVQDTYKGIQGKRFSLFNSTRWAEINTEIDGVQIRPVPVIYKGPWFTEHDCWAPKAAVDALLDHGSLAAPGFKAEGIVVFHEASGHLFKVTLENDEKPKGLA